MPANADSADARSSHSWITASGGNVFYRPRLNNKTSIARFPRPQFAPRRTRPHAIHIITYPSGYVPYDLRPRASSRGLASKSRAARKKQDKHDLKRQRKQQKQQQRQQQPQSQAQNNALHGNQCCTCCAPSPPGETARACSTHETRLSRRLEKAAPIRPVLDKILGSISGGNLTSQRRLSFLQSSGSVTAQTDTDTDTDTHTTAGDSCTSGSSSSNPATQVLQSSPDDPIPSISEIVETDELPQLEPSISAEFAVAQAQADIEATATSNEAFCSSPYDANPIPTTFRSTTAPAGTLHRTLSNQVQPLQRAASTSAALPRPRPRPLSTAVHNTNRNSIMSFKSSASSLVTEVPKPVAAGSGVSCSILLAEPNIFLSGFDHDGHSQREGQSGTALLRGKLQISVSKNVKIKAIQLKLIGRARTEWPEGIPPLKQDVYEEQGLRTQVLTFFNAMYDGWETDYGNQCSYRLKESTATATSYLVVRPSLLNVDSARSSDSRELKRLSLQNVQQRSFNKSESPVASATQAKGFKVFYPGTYDYSFELPIDHHQLETTKLQYGSVRWELHATVDRAGAFKPNLHGMKEVSVVRVPDQMSLEMTEPISISRQWEDQLHYDIIISGKSFPIGSKIPIAFKLTPLAKVQIHKLKVFLTESIEYWTNDRRVTRKDSGRKILLLEKSAGKPLDPAWASSDLRTVRGGELAAGRREEAREMAARRRAYEASRRQIEPEPLPAPSENLLGDLDLGLESFWGSTEIEANVQIPTCEAMAKNKDLRLNPDCSWKNVNVYHWIKIVMRISRLDPDDPTGTKRRHFEISIDSPFTVLNCRATQANTNLPAYSGTLNPPRTYQASCGCPDAHVVPSDVSPSSSTGTLSGMDNRSTEGPLPLPPQAAHLASTTMNPATDVQNSSPPMGPTRNQQDPRPMHLLRAPSFNPPAFDEDTAPPPHQETVLQISDPVDRTAQTPPPDYDIVVGTPSVDGLADYFSRLAEHGYGNEDSSSDSDEGGPPRILERSGRVNVSHPRTPGGRMPSRSMEISRPAITLNMPVPRHAAQTQTAN